MPEATNTPTTSRSLIAILSDCEEFTDRLMGVARLLDHLEATNITIDTRDLAPIGFVIRHATQAIEDLHDTVLPMAQAQEAQAHAKRIPGEFDALVLKINRGRMRELAEATLANLAEMDRLETENGTPAG